MNMEAKLKRDTSALALDEIKALVSAFESTTLPREKWNHHAHLIVALWYLTRYDRKTATNLIRQRIKRYNRAHGILTTKESGYHETMTLFFIAVVISYLVEADESRSLPELAIGLITRFGEKSLPFEFYSKERLMSAEARVRWIEPDLKLLDLSARTRTQGISIVPSQFAIREKLLCVHTFC